MVIVSSCRSMGCQGLEYWFCIVYLFWLDHDSGGCSCCSYPYTLVIIIHNHVLHLIIMHFHKDLGSIPMNPCSSEICLYSLLNASREKSRRYVHADIHGCQKMQWYPSIPNSLFQSRIFPIPSIPHAQPSQIKQTQLPRLLRLLHHPRLNSLKLIIRHIIPIIPLPLLVLI